MKGIKREFICFTASISTGSGLASVRSGIAVNASASGAPSGWYYLLSCLNTYIPIDDWLVMAGNALFFTFAFDFAAMFVILKLKVLSW